MGEPILCYGKSGSGKSRSLKNFAEDEILLVNVISKRMPFQKQFKYVLKSRNYNTIKNQLMIETYKRRVADAKLLGEKFGFLEECVCFIMDDDGHSGRENYAEWLNNLNKMEVK